MKCMSFLTLVILMGNMEWWLKGWCAVYITAICDFFEWWAVLHGASNG